MNLPEIKNNLLKSARQLQEDVPSEYLNIDKLEAYHIPIRTEYCLEYLPEIQENAFKRIATSNCKNAGSSIMEEHPAIATQCGFSARHLWDRFSGDYSSGKGVAPLPALCYAGAVTGKGCHEILFGIGRKAALSRREMLFLNSMNGIYESQKKRIIEFLEERAISVVNPIYVLRTRSYEVAEDMGYDLRYGLCLCSPDMEKTQGMRKFVQWVDRNVHPGNPTDDSWGATFPYQTSQRPSYLYWYRYLILFCGTNLVTADRLLLQDFTPFACLPDGESLSEKQKIWLSAYLNTTTETQHTACAMAFAYWEQRQSVRKS